MYFCTDKIESSIKKKRSDILEELKHKMAKERREKYIGKNLDILVEEIKDNNEAYGYSQNYLRVKSFSKGVKTNEVLNISVKGIEKELLVTNE